MNDGAENENVLKTNIDLLSAAYNDTKCELLIMPLGVLFVFVVGYT